jgi:hypothetical protein
MGRLGEFAKEKSGQRSEAASWSFVYEKAAIPRTLPGPAERRRND